MDKRIRIRSFIVLGLLGVFGSFLLVYAFSWSYYIMIPLVVVWYAFLYWLFVRG